MAATIPGEKRRAGWRGPGSRSSGAHRVSNKRVRATNSTPNPASKRTRWASNHGGIARYPHSSRQIPPVQQVRPPARFPHQPPPERWPGPPFVPGFQQQQFSPQQHFFPMPSIDINQQGFTSQPPFLHQQVSQRPFLHQQVSQPPVEAIELGIEFNPRVLAARHEYVVDSLYSSSTQCSCGLRFRDKGDYRKHLDWHFSQNQLKKAKSCSRVWFLDAQRWIQGELQALICDRKSIYKELEKNEEQKEAGSHVEAVEVDESRVAVPVDDNQSVCDICREKLDDFYSDELDQWMYKGAVYLGDKIVHALCRF